MNDGSQDRSYTRARVSTEEETAQDPAPEAAEAPAPGQPKLRRRPFGYRARDVREALDRQTAELGTRESELAELRQDIAALWLAFAQHDRMLRRALGEEAPQPAGVERAPGERPPAPSPAGPEVPRAEAPKGSAGTAPAPSAAADDAAIGRQLSDLDDVLAAIELATQTLERTYAGEAGRPGTGPAPEPEPEPAAEDGERRAAG